VYSYTGDLVNSVPSGTGTIVWKNIGRSYTGHFSNGAPCGRGVVTSVRSGIKREVEIIDGRMISVSKIKTALIN
jgi:hypothetical protein